MKTIRVTNEPLQHTLGWQRLAIMKLLRHVVLSYNRIIFSTLLNLAWRQESWASTLYKDGKKYWKADVALQSARTCRMCKNCISLSLSVWKFSTQQKEEVLSFVDLSFLEWKKRKIIVVPLFTSPYRMCKNFISLYFWWPCIILVQKEEVFS